jgi:hypothetical protein
MRAECRHSSRTHARTCRPFAASSGHRPDLRLRRPTQSAGAIADSDKLRREGNADQAAGKVKQAVEKAVDKAKELFDDKRK